MRLYPDVRDPMTCTDFGRHRPSVARDPQSRDVRAGREVLYTPHLCMDCGTPVYRAHPTPRTKPWARRDEVGV